MRLLIKNIKKLVQVRDKNISTVAGKEQSILPCIEDAWLAIEDGLIADYGEMKDFPGISDWTGLEIIDAIDRLVFPSWCDSHTHIVFANSREEEFVNRIKGLSYQEIAAKGGGILNSAKKLQLASEEELIISANNRIKEVMMLGTGAIEIKSGYGLTLKDELKMLRVIKKIKETSSLTIKSTFLGAHAIPQEFKGNKQQYISLILNEMLPAVAEEKLADYCDVFCEENYFTYDDTVKILNRAGELGIKAKVHAEQLSNYGGVKAGIACNAISVDHLEYVGDEEIKLLKNSRTMPTILPGAQWFLQLPYPPARKMIDNGLPVAIASDYNPGSSPSGNINFMLSLACVQYKLTPEEAINAATINSAYAMGIEKELGSITIGKKANLFITKEIPDYTFIPYSFANNFIETIIINGKIT